MQLIRSITTNRGSTLVELVLALPLVFVGFFAVLWLALRSVEKQVSVYAMFMGIRAASVQLADADMIAALQMRIIDPRAHRWQQLGPSWRLGHVAQPRGRAVDRGDNPLP